jgi:hypothetical protein
MGGHPPEVPTAPLGLSPKYTPPLAPAPSLKHLDADTRPAVAGPVAGPVALSEANKIEKAFSHYSRKHLRKTRTNYFLNTFLVSQIPICKMVSQILALLKGNCLV